MKRLADVEERQFAKLCNDPFGGYLGLLCEFRPSCCNGIGNAHIR